MNDIFQVGNSVTRSVWRSTDYAYITDVADRRFIAINSWDGRESIYHKAYAESPWRLVSETTPVDFAAEQGVTADA